MRERQSAGTGEFAEVDRASKRRRPWSASHCQPRALCWSWGTAGAGPWCRGVWLAPAIGHGLDAAGGAGADRAGTAGSTRQHQLPRCFYPYHGQRTDGRSVLLAVSRSHSRRRRGRGPSAGERQAARLLRGSQVLRFFHATAATPGPTPDPAKGARRSCRGTSKAFSRRPRGWLKPATWRLPPGAQPVRVSLVPLALVRRSARAAGVVRGGGPCPARWRPLSGRGR
jgi:hypothetical protein